MYNISSLNEDIGSHEGGVSYAPFKSSSFNTKYQKKSLSSLGSSKSNKGTDRIKRRLDKRTEIINTKGLNGEEVILKIDEIKNTLTYLKEYNGVAIKDLKGEAEKKFYIMVKVVDSVYETPSEYQKLFDVVKDVYEDVKDVNFGTVGSYFAACMIDDKMDPKGCGVCSSAGIKLPHESENYNSICMFQVYLVEQKGGSSQLTSLNNSEDKSKSIIYYPKADFDGFTRAQIKSLKEKGVEEVNILHYESDTQNYKMISDGFKPLADVKSIDVEEVHITEKEADDKSMVYIGIAVGIFCLLLILWAILAYQDNKSKGPIKKK